MDQIYELWFPEGSKYQKWWFRGRGSSHNMKQQLMDPDAHCEDESISRIERFLHNSPVQNYDWCENARSCLCGILVYDQMFRHIMRMTPTVFSRAMDLAYYALQKNWIVSYEPHELVFALLPFRHTRDLTHISFCENFIKRLSGLPGNGDGNCDDKNPHIVRFMNALQRQKESLVGAATGEGAGEGGEVVDMKSKLMYQRYYDVLCDEHIYKYNPEYDVLKSRVYKVFRSFVEKNGRFDFKSGKVLFIISLSGGVDSMVCLYLCMIYKKINPMFRFCVAHLNWNLRPESAKERDFILNYSFNNNVDYSINEYHLSRDEDRAKFEKESRELRFAMYREVIEAHGTKGAVFMGHHRGDIVENVFTNMIRGMNYLNLGKMKEIQTINGIAIMRPFLVIPKRDILDVATNCMVPFFKDTTPDWSNRGAVRRRIFPEIEKQFASMYRVGFLRMAERSTQIGSLVEECLIRPYIEKVVEVDDAGGEGDGNGTGDEEVPMGKKEFIMPIYYDRPVIFYELVFERICHSNGVSRMSNKSIHHWYTMYIQNGDHRRNGGGRRKWSCSLGKNMTLEYHQFNEVEGLEYMKFKCIGSNRE
jgi:tRNA(Ile)-lysidine synthetase-like protein